MIEINNLTTTLIEEKILKKVAKKVLIEELRSSLAAPYGSKARWKKRIRSSSLASARASAEEEKAKEDLSIALVGQGKIRALNKKYKGKNRATDVLAFPGDGLGEIVICLREVKKNAKRLGFTFEKELVRVLIHGILHLSGCDHEKSEKGAKKMADKENYYLKLIFR